MINTRIYDRAPLKDVRVKEPQVGRVRTPQILMSRTNEGYQKGDILDANTTAILIKNLHSPDIERLQEQIEEARRKLADAVMKDSVGVPGGVASLDGNGNIPTSQLGNVDVDIFMIVNELPTENIKNNKIYCVKDTESTDENNTYIEYAYINNAWEKVGEFKTDPDLSGYAKLTGDGNLFTNNNTFNTGFVHVQFLNIDHLGFPSTTKFFNLINTSLVSVDKYMSSNGTVEDAGTKEDFVFTLEDGTKVTKSIRVISTTSQAEA